MTSVERFYRKPKKPLIVSAICNGPRAAIFGEINRENIPLPQVIPLEQILEASLEELLAILADARGTHSLEYSYAQIVAYFLRGEVEALRESIQSANSQFTIHEEHLPFYAASQLRLRIRERSPDPSLLEQAIACVASESRWQGELSLLIATFHTVHGNFALGKDWFERARDALARQKCLRKSLRAQLNVIACESHLYPDKNLLANCHDLYRASLRRKQRDLTVATTCLLNISREYQKAGALLAALKYCSRGLTLADFQFGSLTQHLLLAHRAHLYCELGRVVEAQLDFEMAQISNFPEVQAALKVVEPLLRRASEDSSRPNCPANLIPTWKERLLEIEKNGRGARFVLSPLEQRLVEFLAKGPRNRIDILDHMYGEALSYETKINRFKSLIGTLRKKNSLLVIYANDKYSLSDEILLPKLKQPLRKTP